MLSARPPLKDSLCRIVLLGDQCVGKSSYINSLFDEDFDPQYSPTVGVDYRARQISFSNKQSRIHVFDSSGNPELKNVSKSLYQYAEGFIFMYSIGDRGSFESVREWVEMVKGEKKEGVSLILLGNKRDGEEGEGAGEVKRRRMRQVTEEEAREFAEREGMGFYEISAVYLSSGKIDP